MGDGSEGEWICVPRLAVKTYLLIVHVAVRGSIKTRPSPLNIFCRLVLLYHLSFLSNKGPVIINGEWGGGGQEMVGRGGILCQDLIPQYLPLAYMQPSLIYNNID